MASTILLGALIGSIVGAVIGHARSRNALAGALCLACCGALAAYLIAPGPEQAKAVETPEQLEAVLTANRVVLADFYSDRCPPCRKLAPTIASLARHYKGRAAVIKIDVEEAGGLAYSFGIRAIPAVILFVDGVPMDDMLVGCRPESQYRQLLDQALAAD